MGMLTAVPPAIQTVSSVGPATPATTRMKSRINTMKRVLGISRTACAAMRMGEKGRMEATIKQCFKHPHIYPSSQGFPKRQSLIF
jgi:hypothetical protein